MNNNNLFEYITSSNLLMQNLKVTTIVTTQHLQ